MQNERGVKLKTSHILYQNVVVFVIYTTLLEEDLQLT